MSSNKTETQAYKVIRAEENFEIRYYPAATMAMISSTTMAFVLPSTYNETNLPTPNDSSISIVTSEPEYVAVIQFAGFASNESINEHRILLEESLKTKGLSYYGDFRYLGYNPPYQLFDRRNEVIVALNANQFD
ncbi:heme-binding protein, partial [bacterium]|nr:heme-binding protein [bacterium]